MEMTNSRFAVKETAPQKPYVVLACSLLRHQSTHTTSSHPRRVSAELSFISAVLNIEIPTGSTSLPKNQAVSSELFAKRSDCNKKTVQDFQSAWRLEVVSHGYRLCVLRHHPRHFDLSGCLLRFSKVRRSELQAVKHHESLA